MTTRAPAVLVLEDGRTFHGESYGAVGETFGEAVFATAMSGYQETLTDPSFHRQVVCQTAPHIGNTGWNDDDDESDRIWVAGYIVRDPSRTVSSWRARRSLDDELVRQGVVGISGIDTRALTRHLRDRGAMRCGVSSTATDTDAVLERVLASPQMVGANLVADVTTRQPYTVPAIGDTRFRVVAVDLGIKRNTPASLARHGVETVVVPATYTAEQVLALAPDGVFFSNGPGDPDVVDGPRDLLAALLGQVPVFGICMGNQMLGRALGLDTFKLVFGHRGVNQPVQDLATRQVAVTSHNHGFAVAAPGTAPGSTAPVPAGTDPATPFETPFGRAVVSHIDLNDGVVEGLRCLDVPAFSVQYHPEAAPGPHDALGLFERFAELMRAGVPA